MIEVKKTGPLITPTHLEFEEEGVLNPAVIRIGDSYTIMTLSKFYDVFMNDDYRVKMRTAFNWFLVNNRLHKVMYSNDHKKRQTV
jgi:hypothetical protein